MFLYIYIYDRTYRIGRTKPQSDDFVEKSLQTKTRHIKNKSQHSSVRWTKSNRTKGGGGHNLNPVSFYTLNILLKLIRHLFQPHAAPRPYIRLIRLWIRTYTLPSKQDFWSLGPAGRRSDEIYGNQGTERFALFCLWGLKSFLVRSIVHSGGSEEKMAASYTRFLSQVRGSKFEVFRLG